MANNGRNGTGRIYPHNRDANFTGTILGDSIVLDNKYVEGIQESRSKVVPYLLLGVLI